MSCFAHTIPTKIVNCKIHEQHMKASTTTPSLRFGVQMPCIYLVYSSLKTINVSNLYVVVDEPSIVA